MKCKWEIPGQMRLPKKYFSNIPLLALIAANVIPLFGAIFWGWDASNMAFLYWAENLAVGFYLILKIILSKECLDQYSQYTGVHRFGAYFGALCLALILTVPYGFFTAIHGALVVAMFRTPLRSGDNWPCCLVYVQRLINVIRHMSPRMKGALAALFLSHGVSFVCNYLLKGEYASAKPLKLMESPYSRVGGMHVAVIVGAYVAYWADPTMAGGYPLAVLALLVVPKIAIDAKLHLREHEKAKPHALERAQSHVNKDGASIKPGVTEMAEKEGLVVASKVKIYIKGKNMMISSDAIATLSDKVRAILDKAIARAKANRRSTVKPHDL